MLRREYHQWRGPYVPLNIPSCRHTVKFLAASFTGHKNSSFALLFIHAHLNKVADAKEKGKPSEGFGRTQVESVSI